MGALDGEFLSNLGALAPLQHHVELLRSKGRPKQILYQMQSKCEKMVENLERGID